MFELKEPPINIGDDITNKSFEIIKQELKNFDISKFSNDEIEIITRLIHTTSCFEEVINNIYFSKNSVNKIKKLLPNAKIIVDVNMIKVGLSKYYLDKFNNEVICYVNKKEIFLEAQKNKTTRSYAAVVKAIKENKDEKMIFLCGNAPTFIYASINTLIKEKINLDNVAFLVFPVGFVNVIESKEYIKDFSKYFNVPLIMSNNRFGSSTMAVASLHAIYRL